MLFLLSVLNLKTCSHVSVSTAEMFFYLRSASKQMRKQINDLLFFHFRHCSLSSVAFVSLWRRQTAAAPLSSKSRDLGEKERLEPTAVLSAVHTDEEFTGTHALLLDARRRKQLKTGKRN